MTDIKDLNNKMKESGNSSNLNDINDNFARLFCSIFPGLNNQPNNTKETTTKEQEQGN